MANINSGMSEELKKQLEGVNARLERLIFLVQALVTSVTPATVESPAKKKLKKNG